MFVRDCWKMRIPGEDSIRIPERAGDLEGEPMKSRARALKAVCPRHFAGKLLLAALSIFLDAPTVSEE